MKKGSVLLGVSIPKEIFDKIDSKFDSTVQNFAREAIVEKFLKDYGERLNLPRVSQGKRTDLITDPAKRTELASRAKEYMQPRSVAANHLRASKKRTVKKISLVRKTKAAPCEHLKKTA